MNLYAVLEPALIALIVAVSLYHVMKLVMPRVVQGARTLVALRLSRGAGAASWRNTVASRMRDALPENACGAGCDSGCNGCSVAANAGTLVRTRDETAR